MKPKIGNIKRPSRAAGFVNSGKGNAWRANRVCLAIVRLASHQITTYFCVTQKRYTLIVWSVFLCFLAREMGRGDSDDGQAMSRTAQCDGHGDYGVTEDLAGDDVHPAAHHHCQEIYLTGSNGSNPSGRDRRKPAMKRHSPVASLGRSDVGSAP